MNEREREVAEQKRQEAEQGRVAQEQLRRVAEGGPADPDQLEQGRVEAEEARSLNEMIRIEAEEVRVITDEKRGSFRRNLIRLAVAIAPVIAFVALIPSGIGFYVASQQDAKTDRIVQENRDALTYLCQTTSSLSAVIRELEKVDQAFLGDPGLADTVKDKIRSRIRAYNSAQAQFDRREACVTVENGG